MSWLSPVKSILAVVRRCWQNAAGKRCPDFRRAGSDAQRRQRIPYRQSSDFWYFTGFNEPEAVLVLIKSNDTHNHSVIFNRVRDLTAEIWFGRRLGQEAAPEKNWAWTARWPYSEINQQLYQLLNGLDVPITPRADTRMRMTLFSPRWISCVKAHVRICRTRHPDGLATDGA